MNLYKKNAIVPDYYQTYTDNISDDTTALPELAASMRTTAAFFSALPPEKWEYRYAPGKWSLKDMLLHIIDTERVFAYRALRISRGDTTPLPGFEQDDYATNANAGERTPESLLEEYKAVRQSTLLLFESFTADQWLCEGIASNSHFNSLSIAFIIAGHEKHHIRIAHDRYL